MKTRSRIVLFLVVGIYNARENRIDDVYYHIIVNYNSGLYVYPFVGNIKLDSQYISAIPMVGYGSGAYNFALYKLHGR